MAHAQEAVNMQVKAMDQSSGQVNAVSGKPHSKGKGKGTAQVEAEEISLENRLVVLRRQK